MRAFPKPYQRPHPPLIMGGSGHKALECTAELCDGWAPWVMEWSKAKEAIAQLRKLAAANGRDPDSLEISLFEKVIPDEKTITEMEAAGVKRIILTVLGHSRDEALPLLDQLVKISG